MENNNNENNNKSFNSTLIKIIEKKFIPAYNQAMQIILDLFIFNKDLKNLISESKKLSDNLNYYKGDCFLIREDCFSNYKNFYFYENIYQSLSNEIRDIKKYSSSIFENLKEKYKQKYLEKISNVDEIPSIDDENLFNIDYLLNSNETEMIFIYQYSLLNQKIFDSIYSDEKKTKNKCSQTSFIINNKKIIIKYEQKRSLLIGIIADNDCNNIFIPEIIVEYKNIIKMLEAFNYLEKSDYKQFAETLNLNEKINYLKDKENRIIAKVYIIEKNKYENLNKFNQNILLSLYNNYELINKFINNHLEKEDNNQKFVLINKKYIRKIKELFKFEELLRKKRDNNTLNEIIDKNNSYFTFDRNKIRNELSKKELIFIYKTELKIDENNYCYYLKDFELLSFQLMQYLIESDLIKINQELIEIELENFPKDIQIIKNSFSINDNILIILSKNNNEKKHRFQYFLSFKDSIKLNNYLELINKKGIKNIIEELNIKI